MDTIYSLFQKVVKEHENAPAIIENDRAMTFGELSNMVDMITCSFPQEVHSIGIVMRHRTEMIASILAVLKCGGQYVPAEPDFPTGRIHDMMTEAQVDFVLTEHAFAPKLSSFPIRYTDCEICGVETPSWKRNAIEDPERPAYVLYTSGTTGRPKGVCVTNRNVCHYVRAFANEFHPGPGDVMLQYSVCSFDIFVEEVFTSLLNGAALAIPADEDKADIHALMAFVERHHVTMISGFPYLLAEMNHLSVIPSSLRLLISGGDVLRGVYVDHLLNKAEVYNTYGPSETTVCASYYRCNSGTVLEDGTYPIGHPVLGAQIRILDQSGNEVAKGQTGEICIYGGGVSLGYIGDHAEENSAFERQPDGSTMYRSGDLGYILPDGNIAFLHRKDDQIMIYGKRVELAEVESRLYRCKDVQQAIVRAFTDEDGLSYMTAYVVPSDNKLKVSEVKKELSENLTSFMIPEFFVKMKQIPLNVNGKPDVSKLPVVMKAGGIIMEIQIRQATIQDLNVLMQWRMEVLHEVFSIPSERSVTELESENRRYYQTELPQGGHIACFAYVGEEIVGCGGICLYHEMPSPDNLNGKCAYLMNIYTRPQFRGHGIGNRIVRWLVEQARQRHISKIYLETSDKGRPLYQTIGFADMKDMMKLSREK